MSAQDPMFSRSALGGKRNSKVEARITDDTKELLRRRCNELGMTESDYIERLVCVSLYGFEHVVSLERQKTTLVLGLSAHAPH